jgi:predicted Zn-dependent peptidase
MKPKSYNLKNGLIINHFHTDFKDMFRMEIIIRAGSLDEQNDEIGFMHFLEHLMSFFPSESRPDSLRNQHELGNRGIDCNAYTSTNTVRYYLEGLSTYQDLIIEMMMDNYVCKFENPKIFDNLFKQEVNAVVSELYRIIDDNDYTLASLINFISFPDTNLAFTTDYEKDNVKKNATIENVLALRNKWYIPEYTSIMIISNHTGRQFKKLVDNISRVYFPNQNSNKIVKPKRFGTLSPISSPLSPPLSPTLSSPLYKFYYIKPKSNSDSGTVNIHIQFPLDITVWDHENYALTALSFILTSGMSSRLYFALRSHLGAVYGVESEVALDTLDKKFGTFYIHVETSINKAPIVFDYILSELQQLLDEEITDNDIIKYRETITVEYNHLKDSKSFMRDYEESILCLTWGHKLRYIDEIYKKKMNVTKRDILNVANKFLIPKNMVVFYSSDKQVLLNNSNKNTYLEVDFKKIRKL